MQCSVPLVYCLCMQSCTLVTRIYEIAIVYITFTHLHMNNEHNDIWDINKLCTIAAIQHETNKHRWLSSVTKKTIQNLDRISGHYYKSQASFPWNVRSRWCAAWQTHKQTRRRTDGWRVIECWKSERKRTNVVGGWWIVKDVDNVGSTATLAADNYHWAVRCNDRSTSINHCQRRATTKPRNQAPSPQRGVHGDAQWRKAKSCWSFVCFAWFVLNCNMCKMQQK